MLIRYCCYLITSLISEGNSASCLMHFHIKKFWALYYIYLLQTNPFDLFETFFGPSMGGFGGMDPTGFRTRRSSTVTKGEDIR